MKNFVDYTSKKCFASARVVAPRLDALATQYHSHLQNIIFSTSDPNNYPTCNLQIETSFVFGVSIDKTQFPQVDEF
jgi:hypothetical protein